MGDLATGLRLYTIPEVAECLRFGERWVKRQAREGRLKVIRCGSRVRVHPMDLRAFIDALRVDDEPPAR